MERVHVRKTPKLSEGSREANENLIEVLSARRLVAVKRAAKTVLAVMTCINENDGPSDDMFVIDLHEKFVSNSSAKNTLSKGFAKAGTSRTLLKKLLLILLQLNETCGSRDR